MYKKWKWILSIALYIIKPSFVLDKVYTIISHFILWKLKKNSLLKNFKEPYKEFRLAN